MDIWFKATWHLHSCLALINVASCCRHAGITDQTDITKIYNNVLTVLGSWTGYNYPNLTTKVLSLDICSQMQEENHKAFYGKENVYKLWSNIKDAHQMFNCNMSRMFGHILRTERYMYQYQCSLRKGTVDGKRKRGRQRNTSSLNCGSRGTRLQTVVVHALQSLWWVWNPWLIERSLTNSTKSFLAVPTVVFPLFGLF